MAAGDRGSRGRDEYGSGSDHRKGSSYQDRDRADRNRESYKDRKAAEDKRRQEAAKKEAARKEAERKAREEAERKAEAKAQKEAEEAAAAETAQATKSGYGFSPMGGLSSYGLDAQTNSPVGGRGVLAGMRSANDLREEELYERSKNPTEYSSIHFRAPTDDEVRAGIYTNENAYSGEAINEDTSEGNIARLAGDAIDSKQAQIARDFVSSPFGSVGSLVSDAVGWVSDLFDDDTDYEKNLKEQAKQAMEAGDNIRNIGGAVQAGTALGAMKGVSVAQKLAPAILSPVMGSVLSVADNAVGLNRYIDQNREYLEQHDLLDDISSNHDRDSGRSGILNNMTSNPSVSKETVLSAQPSLPDFEWVNGEQFNTDYGMRFKR